MDVLFSKINCTAVSAIGAPKLELHDVGLGSDQGEYKVACTSFDLSGGVNLVPVYASSTYVYKTYVTSVSFF
jgi:hypothetical protein